MSRKLLVPTLGLTLVVAVAAFAPPAHATYIVTLTQVGNNVVATGNGTVDLSGLTFKAGNFPAEARINPSLGTIYVGSVSSSTTSVYTGVSGPSNFGSGTLTDASSGSGGLGAIGGSFDELLVPSGYTSGSLLSDTSTWDNQTLTSLGVTPGTYTWTWGSGATADSFKLVAEVPEPGSLALFAAGIGLIGFLIAWRRPRVQV